MSLAEQYRGPTPGLSFEVYPPKSADGLEPVYGVVGELVAYRPTFVSVTYGAGGSTRDQTLEMAGEIHRRFGGAATAHLTCVGATVEQHRQWLARAAGLGIRNIMALRGDPPQGQQAFTAVEGGLSHASNLVHLLRGEFPRFGVGVAGYPETHQEATSPADDLRYLQLKVERGGQVVFTQLFYDNDDFWRFRDRCVALGIAAPIVPGLLPILSFAQIKRITALCKARLPTALHDHLETRRDDPAGQIQVGIDHARRQTEDLLRGGVPGIHFYVLNRSDAVHRILDGLVASDDRLAT